MSEELNRSFVPLDARVEVVMGRQRSPRHADGEHIIPYLRAANVKDGRLELDDVLEMNFAPSEQAKFRLEPGDVLVTEGCGSLNQIGASSRWDAPIAGVVAFQNTLLRLRALEGRSDPEFIHQWARWAFESGAFAQTATGTSIFHIGAKRAASMHFPDISLEEQGRCADVLSFFDAHIDLMRGEELRLKTLSDALRGKMRSLATTSMPLGEIAIDGGIQIGPFGSQLHASDYVEVGIPVVMPKDMRRGRIDTASIARIGEPNVARLARHHLLPGDLLLPRRGDLTKRALVRDEEAGWICGTGSIRVRVPQPLSRLVFEAISTDEASQWLIANAVGTTMLNLNTEIVARLPLFVADPEEARPYLGALQEIETLAQDLSERTGRAVVALRAVRHALMTGTHVIPDAYHLAMADDPERIDALVLA